MMIFRINERIYRGESALAIVTALEGDTADYPDQGRPVRHFLIWSLERLRDHIPPREMDLSDRMADEELALNYLYLRDEYGAGKLMVRHGDLKAKSAADP